MTWKKVLALAPHTDDAEFGCGGTLSRLAREGAEVEVLAFSCCGSPELLQEAREAAAMLGVGLTVANLNVRHFYERRQDILDRLITYRDWPDVVLTPARRDVHQDHSVVTAEAIRAFKQTTVLGYELPWNSLSFDNQLFMRLTTANVKKKVEAINCFQSQQHRHYAQRSAIRATARAMGVHIGCEYAEAFEVYRVTL